MTYDLKEEEKTMASYSIGDESDDEFDLQGRGAGSRGAAPRSQAHAAGGGGAGLAPVSSRQPHQYIDPFDDDFASPSTSSANPQYQQSGASNNDTRAPRAYDDALIFDDFTGGKPANPLGTASVVRDAAHASDFNRYDVYDE